MVDYSLTKGERVGIISLGCARNTVDSEKILTDLKFRGACICPVESASTVVVNTCAFIKESKEESIGVILDLIDLKKKGRIKKIVVHGCLSERYEQELRSAFKEVDAFCGIAGFKRSFDKTTRLTPGHSAYLKVCEGCANLCSYCAIPLIKGPLRSRSESSILDEASKLEACGVRELNIVGQDITLFGMDKKHKKGNPVSPAGGTLPLVGLLKKILKSTRIPWVRLLYLHPRRMTGELIELFASEDRVCPYVDMPLQHISDRILRLMNRGIDKKKTVELIEKLRKRLAGVALRTTLITGFPSETGRDFEELKSFVATTCFDKLGVFAYSNEEGTRAYRFKGQVSEAVKKTRYNALMSLQKNISRKLLKKEIGRTIEVMVDEASPDSKDTYLCRTRKDAPEVDGIVFLRAKSKLRPGAIIKCRVVDSLEYDLIAQA